MACSRKVSGETLIKITARLMQNTVPYIEHTRALPQGSPWVGDAPWPLAAADP